MGKPRIVAVTSRQAGKQGGRQSKMQSAVSCHFKMINGMQMQCTNGEFQTIGYCGKYFIQIVSYKQEFSDLILIAKIYVFIALWMYSLNYECIHCIMNVFFALWMYSLHFVSINFVLVVLTVLYTSDACHYNKASVFNGTPRVCWVGAWEVCSLCLRKTLEVSFFPSIPRRPINLF